MSLVSEFRDFVVKGNVLDLAVAFIMGTAFSAVITALVTDIITPIIGIPGAVNFAAITYTVHGSTFMIGAFINAVIAFLSIAVAIFFFVIKPVSKAQNKLKKPQMPGEPTTKECPYCLSTIPIKAARCAFCTSRLKK